MKKHTLAAIALIALLMFCGTVTPAPARAEGDPAVKAGRLVVDLYPWNIPKGSLR